MNMDFKFVRQTRRLEDGPETDADNRDFDPNFPIITVGKGLTLSMKLFYENRRRLMAALKDCKPDSLAFFQGGTRKDIYNSDEGDSFRQESYFYWLFGIKEPGYYGLIDVEAEKTYIFYPEQPIKCPDCPRNDSESQMSKNFTVDYVKPVGDMDVTLSILDREWVMLLTGSYAFGTVLFQDASLWSLSCYSMDKVSLWRALANTCAVKTSHEMDLIRFSTRISCEAVKYILKTATPGLQGFQIDALFKFYVNFIGGCESFSSKCEYYIGEDISKSVCRCRNHIGVLVDGQLCVLDVGAYHFGYCFSVVVTFPVSGRFSKEQEELCDIVLQMRKSMLDCLKPGSLLGYVEKTGYLEMLEGFKSLNVLAGSPNAMLEQNVHEAFVLSGDTPMIGVCLLNNNFTRPIGPDCSSEGDPDLLENPQLLAPGMVVYVEPKCHVSRTSLETAGASSLRYFWPNEIDRYVGNGIKFRDLALITVESYELLSDLPRSGPELLRLRRKSEDFRSTAGSNFIDGTKLDMNPSSMVKQEMRQAAISSP